MAEYEFRKRIFEVTVEQFIDPDEPAQLLTEDAVQRALHRALDGEYDLGAITVTFTGRTTR